MVDDVDDLLGEQPGVDRMADRSHTGDTEVKLHVAVAVPCQRGDAVAPLDPELGQRVGQLP